MQLLTALHAAGYTVVDLYERVNRKYAIDYQKVAKYCRCFDRGAFKKEVWDRIDKCLREMEVNW